MVRTFVYGIMSRPTADTIQTFSLEKAFGSRAKPGWMHILPLFVTQL